MCAHLWAAGLVATAMDWGGAGGDGAGLEPLVERDPPWRDRMRNVCRLGYAREEDDPWGEFSAARMRHEYVVDLRSVFTGGSIEVELYRYKTRKDGSWGVGRPKAISERSLAEIDDPEDERLTQMLWALHGSPWYESTKAFRIPFAAARPVLDQLVRAGRCRFRLEDESLGPPLTRDDGPPWEFAIEWSETESGGRVEGVLERGDRSVRLDEPLFVLHDGLGVLDDRLVDIDLHGAWPLLADLRRHRVMTVSSEDVDAFRATLLALPDLPVRGLDLDQGVARVTPTPCLFVESPDMGRNRTPSRLRCRVEFEYEDLRVGTGPGFDSRFVLDDEGSVLTPRDLPAERAAIARLVELGVRPSSTRARDPWEAVLRPELLTEVVFALVAEGWIVEAKGDRVRGSPSWSVSVASGIDWFELQGGLAFGDDVVSFPQLLEARESGDRIVRLGDGTVGILPETWLEDWGLIETVGEVSTDGLRVAKNQAWVLDALLAARADVPVDERFAEHRERIRRFESVTPIEESPGFGASLRPYQREGLGWMEALRELGFGGCLADDMGLGKTVEVLALLHRRHRSGEATAPSLVVAPKSVVFNWIREAERFAPDLRVLDYTGPKRKERRDGWSGADLVVTTYGSMRNDIVELRETRFDYVILDESQAIKNAGSQVSKAARLLEAEHRLALSGTPIENHLGELWSLFEFLNPGMLGRSSTFKQLVGTGRPGDAESRAALAAGLRPFILRRTKEQVLEDLPEKTEQVLHCELSGRQSKEYAELASHYRAILLGKAEDEGLGRMKIQVLEALLRLRQAACHPALIDKTRAGEGSAKLDVLLPRLTEIVESGHKALVFSQFTRHLAVIRDRLDALSIGYEYLDGRTTRRDVKVDRFQSDPDCPVFLMSLKAGGVGLNLTAASYVFILDPWWNPAAENQAVDRAHRIGQTKPVMTYRLITRGTVEEKVRELQSAKLALADAVLGEDNAVLRDLTSEDLGLLLS